jgi:hypothetical protein
MGGRRQPVTHLEMQASGCQPALSQSPSAMSHERSNVQWQLLTGFSTLRRSTAKVPKGEALRLEVFVRR